ncbi:MAG TPA: mechanosensitive ion channel domain-containing protein [Gemmatimonadaceae bacterium]|jgi:small-conductance mechanosensitive channel
MINLAVRRGSLTISLGAAAVLILGTAASATGQRATAATAVTPDSLRSTADSLYGAPVVFEGDTLLRLYGSLGPFAAVARATAVVDRLGQIRSRVARGTDSITVLDRGAYTELVAGDVVVMTVLDEDARPIARARNDAARMFADGIRRELIIAETRSSSRALGIGASLALVTTVALLAILWALAWLYPRLYARIDALRGVRIPDLKIQQFELLSAGRLSSLLVRAAQLSRVALTLLVFYVYVPLVLSFFPWTLALSREIVSYAVTPFAAAWQAFVAYLPNVFYIAAIVVITRYALRGIHALFRAVGDGAITFREFHRDWAEPTYKIVRVLLLAFAAVVVFPYLPGARSDAFKGVSLFLGVLFSLGSSSAIGNMVAGVVLTYTRAFQIGDRVTIGETTGDVTEKTLLVTRVRTIKNVEITIPNGTVLGAQVVNYSTLALSRGLILHTTVTIGYDAPWRTVHDLLNSAAARTEHIVAEPKPFVLQTSLDDFYVSYELNAYTARADLMAVIYSHLHQNIQESFNTAGVEIMSPHYRALRDGDQTTIPRSSACAQTS